MKKYHIIENITVAADGIFLHIDDKKYVFKLPSVSRKLSLATQAERETYEVSPSGYGIHWPLIDEDLSIDGLLKIKHKPMHTNCQSSGG